MTLIFTHPESGSGTPSRNVEPNALHPILKRMIDERLDHVASVETIVAALAGTPEDLQAVTSAFATSEGYLLEAGFRLIAEQTGAYRVLKNIKLPILRAAEDAVGRNDPSALRGITFDADTAGRKSYTPDAILIEKASRNAILVDLKRDLSGYDLTTLRDRMLAAALIARDYLYKYAKGIQVEEVGSVIISANGARTDAENGICAIGDLDHLLRTAGVGETMAAIPKLFAERKIARWEQARAAYHRRLLSGCDDVAFDAASPTRQPTVDRRFDPDDEPVDDLAGGAMPPSGHAPRVGFLTIQRHAAA